MIIALPAHLHAPVTIAALRSGKHVLVEKMMGQTVSQCKQVARVAKEAGLVLSVGYQRHEIKDSAGNVLYECPPIEELIRWRLWNRTGSGLLGELGSHQIDGACLLAGFGADESCGRPLSVTGFAARSVFPAEREVNDHACATFEFAGRDYDEGDVQARQNRIAMQQSVANGNGFGRYGEMIFGTKGTLILQRETEAMLFDNFGPSESKLRVVQGSDGPRLAHSADGDPSAAALGNMATIEVSRGYREQMEHWAWCIRNPDPENQPRSDAKVGLANAVLTRTAQMAASGGRRIEFRPSWFDPDSDETPETA